MNLYKLLPLLSALLLAGCKEDFMTLHFESSLERPNALLMEAIRAHGIPPEKIELKRDLKDSKVIHLALKSELSTEQRATLRALFDDIIKAREASSMAIDMTLEARPEDSNPKPITLNLTVSSTAQVWANYRLIDRGLGYYNQSGVPARVVCSINGKLNGELPVQGVSVQQIPEQSPEHVYLNYTWNHIRKKRISAHMLVKDAQLRESINKGEIRLWSEQQVTNDLLRTDLQLRIEVGELGNHLLNANFNDDSRIDTWTGECMGMIAHLGRPFSFHIGSSLDRLKSVTYKDASGS